MPSMISPWEPVAALQIMLNEVGVPVTVYGVLLGQTTPERSRSPRLGAYAVFCMKYRTCWLAMVRMFALQAFLLLDSETSLNLGMAMAASMPMITTTIINSIRVNPLFIARSPR